MARRTRQTLSAGKLRYALYLSTSQTVVASDGVGHGSRGGTSRRPGALGDSPAHAQAFLRLQSGQPRDRYPKHPGLLGASFDYEHDSLYCVGFPPICEILLRTGPTQTGTPRGQKCRGHLQRCAVRLAKGRSRSEFGSFCRPLRARESPRTHGYRLSSFADRLLKCRNSTAST